MTWGLSTVRGSGRVVRDAEPESAGTPPAVLGSSTDPGLVGRRLVLVLDAAARVRSVPQ